jgi:hypothetical protein
MPIFTMTALCLSVEGVARSIIFPFLMLFVKIKRIILIFMDFRKGIKMTYLASSDKWFIQTM